MRIDAEERTRRIEAIAQEALALFGAGRQVEPFASRHPGFDLGEAYAVAARVRDLRAARGERAVGRKIGFTNPTVQRIYGVHGPIWNFMFDSTVHDLAAIGGRFALAGLPEPRIEPEIVFHLAAAPRADMDDEALLGCVDWVAHGFEIVQSIFPGWRFTAADCGRRLTAFTARIFSAPGARSPTIRRAWARALSDFTIELRATAASSCRDMRPMSSAARSRRCAISCASSNCPRADDPLRPGEIVTTGTLTDAPAVAAGQTWSTTLEGVALEGLRLEFK